MSKTLKQYLSLRGLLVRKLKKQKRELEAINELLLEFPKVERMLAYCRDNEKVVNCCVYLHKSNSNTFTKFEVNFIGLQKAYVVSMEDLLKLNLVSEQFINIKVK